MELRNGISRGWKLPLSKVDSKGKYKRNGFFVTFITARDRFKTYKNKASISSFGSIGFSINLEHLPNLLYLKTKVTDRADCELSFVSTNSGFNFPLKRFSLPVRLITCRREGEEEELDTV